MEFETKIYPQIGGYGRYNRIITLFSWFPNFAVSLNLFSDVFFTLVPESYHCRPDPALLPPSALLGNLSRRAYLNLTVPWLKGSGFSHCELYKYPVNVSDYSEDVPREVVRCTRGWEYGKPAGLHNNLVTEWDLVCADYWKIPLQHICFMTGWILGYILLGTICDWLGRRCALLLSVVLSGLLGIMTCLSNSPSAFPFLRLCQGSTLAGVFLSSYIAKIDEVFPEDTQPEYHHVVELRQTRVIWKNCLILGFTLFIGTGIQYCFTRNLHIYSPHFYFSYFLRVLTGALACIFLCVSVDRFGRRGMLLLAAIVTGLSSLLLLALTQYLHGGFVLVLSVVGLLSSQALAMLSVFFGSEVMPTVVRGGTLGLIMAAGCVGMAASSLMELQNNGGYFLHHVIFASFAVLSVLCIMLLPESKYKPLPDSLKDGERQRRPPLFLSRTARDNPPLLHTQPHSSEYNRDNYSRLVTATKKMLTKDTLPYKISISPQAPLLASNGTAPDANEDSS
ncbi:putative solute carrier family 22 member 31 isoform X2 [Puntigrus tetrazona]|uniref:putative solute carrier family 22 member 31 isoform X2 n=1 Tax=Puntigrus tetrazona TaxID=1606681 RepID=UPI001C899BA6|nr:putative solute carrier family 22 member 31 isoform X2 [Puntigrus tetrazona]